MITVYVGTKYVDIVLVQLFHLANYISQVDVAMSQVTAITRTALALVDRRLITNKRFYVQHDLLLPRACRARCRGRRDCSSAAADPVWPGHPWPTNVHWRYWLLCCYRLS